MANGVDDRRSYERELFIGREEPIQQAKDWIRSGKKKILPVIGTPGIGKSWFLQRLKDEIQDGVKPLYLVVPVADPKAENDNWDEQKIQSWVTSQVADLKRDNHACRFPEWDDLVEFPQMVTKIAEAMCQCYSNQRIPFFIDGLDALSEEAWQRFESQVITVFARHDCFRFILAFRNNQRLNAIHLKLQSEEPLRLLPFSEAEGKEQIEKLKSTFRASLDYGLVHPQINDFMVRHGEPWGEDGVKSALKTLRQFTPDAFDKLKQAIGYFNADGFTVTDVQNALRLTRSGAWQWIDELRQNYWIYYDSQTGKYQVTDGLRQFLLAAKTKGLF